MLTCSNEITFGFNKKIYSILFITLNFQCSFDISCLYLEDCDVGPDEVEVDLAEVDEVLGQAVMRVSNNLTWSSENSGEDLEKLQKDHVFLGEGDVGRGKSCMDLAEGDVDLGIDVIWI